MKQNCFTAPIRIYLLQIIIPSVSVILLLYFTKTKFMLIIKTVALIFVFSTLLGLITYIYSKKVFNKVLFELKNLDIYAGKIRFNFRLSILMQFLPLIIVAVLFPTVIGYSTLTEERGNLIFEEYQTLLSQNFDKEFTSYDELLDELKKISLRTEYDCKFIIDSNRNIVYSENNQISNFFIKYMFEVSENLNGHVYDYYGSDIQGVVKKINIDNQWFYLGIMYSTYSYSGNLFLVSSVLIILFGCILFLLYFSKNISKDISAVGKYLSELSTKNEINYDDKLLITSNDEIGELLVSFNKLLDLEKQNIATLERNQEIMVEQERLSSLGQLIGGIAHNLKTPIMSIAGVLEGITDLIDEYDESIEDPNVTKEDHHEIANDMRGWIEKVKPYLSYMTEIIDAVKGQAVSMNASTMKYFTAKELVLRIQLLMKNELKRRHCTLNLDNIVDESTSISGEISAIIQVIDNMIINSMDAYKDAPGSIDVTIKEDEVKVYIDVKDYAGGIPKNVQEKLFNEMVTSKGKNGTGLGLYMSFSTIKGKFKGDIKYETEEGKGTTFFIELPKYRPGMENKEEEGEEEEK